VFIWGMRQGVYGFVVIKTISEIVNLLLLLSIFGRYAHLETRMLHTLRDYFDFGTFAKYATKYFMIFFGWLPGFFGIELLTVNLGVFRT
jgi:hypothetical protein